MSDKELKKFGEEFNKNFRKDGVDNIYLEEEERINISSEDVNKKLESNQNLPLDRNN